ncbi:helix-turn-helix transcriptional regulator [Methylobacterium oxalidis]
MTIDHLNRNSSFNSDLLTRVAAAKLLDVSPRTLDRWHLERTGPPRITIGRKVRYRLASINRWLATRETVPQLSQRHA